MGLSQWVGLSCENYKLRDTYSIFTDLKKNCLNNNANKKNCLKYNIFLFKYNYFLKKDIKIN